MGYVLEDDHLSPIYLYSYLERLLPRVAARVTSLTEDYGPVYKSGSVMGFTDHKHEVDSGSDQPVFDLAVTLIEWRGRGIGTSSSASEQQLREYLMKYRISDEELVLGGKQVGHGLLKEIKRDVKRLLKQSDDVLADRRGAERCYELAVMLRGFASSGCVHIWEDMSDHPGVEAMRCSRCSLPNTA